MQQMTKAQAKKMIMFHKRCMLAYMATNQKSQALQARKQMINVYLYYRSIR